MLQISDIRLPVGSGEGALQKKIVKLLGCSHSDIETVHIVRQSIDARKKAQVQLVYSVRVLVANEEEILCRNLPKVKRVEEKSYQFPPALRKSGAMPVVVGMGPAGLFCALYLARNGIPCVLLERGCAVETREKDVARFWAGGELNPNSNVQFGEGGAGTFSDGKLTTGTHDARISAVLQSLVAAGAPEDVLFSHKSHYGSDVLRDVVRNIRRELLRLGCEIHFESRFIGICRKKDRLAGVIFADGTGEHRLDTDTLVLAIGHSARDTFSLLQREGLAMERKPFSIGVRIEHHQHAISHAQYGDCFALLPPSDYKLSCHLPCGRSAYTFCVCPGGQVVASASEHGHLVTNGMSCRARDGENINGGFLVGVNPSDFTGDDPLAGIEFQRRWEAAAYQLGGGDYHAPAQLVGDFLAGRASVRQGNIVPTYSPGVKWTDVGLCLPEFVSSTLRQALTMLDRKLHGFAHPQAVLTGIETRSSSPVRVLRNESLQASLAGIYPCGEGCGYAGGIVSAAVDGIRVAEQIALNDTTSGDR